MNRNVLKDVLYVIDNQNGCEVHFRDKKCCIENKHATEFLEMAYRSYGCDLHGYKVSARVLLDTTRRVPFCSPEGFIIMNIENDVNECLYVNNDEVKKIKSCGTKTCIIFYNGQELLVDRDVRILKRQKELTGALYNAVKKAEATCFESLNKSVL